MASIRIQVVLKEQEQTRLLAFCEEHHVSISSFARSQIMSAIDYFEANPNEVKRKGDLF